MTPGALPPVAGPTWGQSPHLAQHRLRTRLVRLLRLAVAELRDDGLPGRALELGAGHGPYAEVLLAAGWQVTVVDQSRDVVDVLHRDLGDAPGLTVHHDLEAGLAAAAGEVSLVLGTSVLHHVPDYLQLLATAVRHLVPGGQLLTVQDPLHYPRVPAVTRRLDRAAYVAWRLGQGQVRQGAAAALRRVRRRYPEPRPGEVVYHHVVREGVDEQAVAALLQACFADVRLMSYWSHHVGALQTAADRLGLANTFAVRARGYAPAG